MSSSKEQQGEIRKPSSVINEKKQRKTVEWKDQRPLQENQRYQGNIACKDGHNKDRNRKDQSKAEEIKKRWQEYTEELYKKNLNDPDNHDAAVTHLEPDILKCEVKWALRSITINKASGGDGIPAELLKILMMLLN